VTEAAKTGNLDVVELFLKKNRALVFAHSEEDHSTAWHLAAQGGHDEVLKLLISVTKEAAVSNNFNPVSKVINEQNAKGQTALMLACRGGYYRCAKLLINQGADPLPVDSTGLNALHYAALGSNEGIIAQLLKAAKLWGPQGPRPPKPEDTALQKFVNCMDPYGRTPLHYAAWTGQLDGAQALLSAGANIIAKSGYDCYESSLPCNSGTTPLHLAALKGHKSVVVLILTAYVRILRKWEQLHAKQVPAGAAAAEAGPSAAAGGKGSPTDKPQPMDPRTVLDAYGNTPYHSATSSKHDDEALLTMLNPKNPIKEKDLKKLVGNLHVQTMPRRGANASTSSSDTEGEYDSYPSTPGSQESVNNYPKYPSPGVSIAAAVTAAADSLGSSVKNAGGQRRARASAAGGHPHVAHADGHAQGAGHKGAGHKGHDEGAHGQGHAGGQDDADKAQQRHHGVAHQGEKDKAAGGAADGQDQGNEHHGEADARRASKEGPAAEAEAAGEQTAGKLNPGEQAGEPPGASGAAGTQHNQPATEQQQQQQQQQQPGAGEAADAGPPKPTRARRKKGRRRRAAHLNDDCSSQGSSDTRLASGIYYGFGPGTAAATAPAIKGCDSPLADGAVLASRPVPDCFLCPMTCKLLQDPVVAADGFTYEREAIEKHLKGGSIQSPVNPQQKLASTALYPNKGLKQAIEWWAAANQVYDLLPW